MSTPLQAVIIEKMSEEELWTEIEIAYHEDNRERLMALGEQVPPDDHEIFERLLAEFDGNPAVEVQTAYAPSAPPQVGINGGACVYPTIGAAITAASSGDTIYLPSGTYYETLGIIDKDLTFTAALADCSGADPSAGVAIDGSDASAIRGGMAEIDSDCTVTFNNIYLSNAGASYGGILYVGQDATVILDDSKVAYGSASAFGGGIRVYINGTLRLINGSSIHLNETTGTGDGGGIAVYQGSVIVTDKSTVGLGSASNTSADKGGGIYSDDSTIQIHEDGMIVANSATNEGGGIYATGTSQIWLSRGGRIGDAYIGLGNNAVAGAGAYLLGDSILYLQADGHILNNSASGDGGGVYADAGAVVAIEGNSRIADNRADDNGGGIYTHASLVSTINGHIMDNWAGNIGGGIAARYGSTVTLRALMGTEIIGGCNPAALAANTYCSEVKGNEAESWGAGIYVERSELTVISTAFLNNEGLNGASSPGTAILIGEDSSAVVANSLIMGNNANAVHVYSGASYRSDSNTYAGNLGIPLYAVATATQVDLKRNILWDNGQPTYLQVGTPLDSYCNDAEIDLGGTDDVSIDPRFQTTSRGDYRLQRGSPAIDACDAGPAYDHDNVTRPQDGDLLASTHEYDMGAFEFVLYPVYLPLVVR
jgi:predicted outer membrane repeat protein